MLACQQALTEPRRASSLWRLEPRLGAKVLRESAQRHGSLARMARNYSGLPCRRSAVALLRAALKAPGGGAGGAARRASAVEARALAWTAWARRCLRSAPAGAAAGAAAPGAAGALSAPSASGGWDAEGQAVAAAALAAQAPLVASLDDVAVQARPTGACSGAGTPCSAPLECRPTCSVLRVCVHSFIAASICQPVDQGAVTALLTLTLLL